LARPATAAGQSTTDRWQGLAPSGLQTVYVRDRLGVETPGRLLGLNPDSLLLLVNGVERRFDIADVARVQKRDSLRNGTIIGAIVGVGMGLVAAGLSDCPGEHPGGNCAGFRAAGVAVSTGVYAGLGAGIDALVRGRTTIYAASQATPAGAMSEPGLARPTLRLALSW
jgi:hypothetical protein